MSIYLDHAAATPLDNDVLKAMMPYLTDMFYNPSALYMSAKSVNSDLASARSSVAAVLGARPIEITFTAGGTEANNLAINGVMKQYPDANIVVSSVEHESVLEPARQYNCREIPVGQEGLVDITDLTKLIDDKTVMVSIMYANNEIGTIQPLRDITNVIKQKLIERQQAGNSLPLLFHTDACQAANYLDLHVSKKGIDLLTLNGSKLYGPKQS
ncbi:MAG: aminotransferase class V-fold PLP-dependent enzyme, partial [Candidatus Saccharimonadales bacterium]